MTFEENTLAVLWILAKASFVVLFGIALLAILKKVESFGAQLSTRRNRLRSLRTQKFLFRGRYLTDGRVKGPLVPILRSFLILLILLGVILTLSEIRKIAW